MDKIAINEALFENYRRLRKVLTDATETVLDNTRDKTAFGLTRIANMSIGEWHYGEWGAERYALPFLFSRYADSYPWEVKDNGDKTFTLLMASPNSTDEKNLDYDSLYIATIGDIFQAMRVVENAFWGMIERKMP